MRPRRSMAPAGLREASLGKNDNGCLFIVTEMCAGSAMKQRRPLVAAEAAPAGTWFQKLSHSSEVVKANFMHICEELARFTSRTIVEKSFFHTTWFILDLLYCTKIGSEFPSVVHLVFSRH